VGDNEVRDWGEETDHSAGRRAVLIRCVTAPNPGPFTLDGTNSYVIGDHTIIDPGPQIDSHVEALLEAAPNLRRIFVTHRHADHAPAARELTRRTAAVIIAPDGVDGVSERTSDGRIDDLGETTLTTVSTPGHTAEHVCYLTAEGELFTGDTVLGWGTTAIFPPDGRMGDYLASLAKIRALPLRRIYPGHGPVIEDPAAVIDGYIDHRHQREEQILGALREGPLDLAQLRERIYPDLAPGLGKAAEAQLEAHLIHLVEQGQARHSALWELWP
jgi:glyoxylase-like metal-dependent hydrolase (beta-lactamase superfamily II)